jgi:O-antigen/teichoic acid export membrane protein
VLGVHDYGIVSFYTALVAFLGVIIEFGFDWLGIREVSRAGDDPEHQHRILSNVTAAKLLICAVTCATYAPALYLLRGSTHAGFILATVVYMVGFAMDVGWYFRALERMRSLLVVTLLTRLSGLALLWTIVTQPGDMVQALWSYAFVAIANATIGWAVVAQQGLAGHVRPQWSVITPLMRDASAIVIGNLSGALLTNGGVALLGMTANPATVGAANLALRIKMAGQALLLPIKQLSYVRLSALASTDRRRALRIGRIVLGAMLAGGSAIGIAIAISAEWIVHQVFLGEHPTAVALVMVLGLSVPINSVADLFGMQCLIAFGRERSYAVVVFVAAMVFCVFLVVLRGELAYGWALLIAEASMGTLAGWRLSTVLRRIA